MLVIFRDFVIENVLAMGGSLFGAVWMLVAATILLAVITYYLAKWVLILLEKIVLRSSSDWDDDLLNMPMLNAIAQLAPALSINWVLPILFVGETQLPAWIATCTKFYIVWAFVRIFTIFITNLYEALARRDNTRDYAVKGIFQMLRLIAIGVGVIIGLSIVLGKEPTAILAAIGASAAILMLVFKDTILGLVASVQLTANKMLKRGDWIEADKTGINGEVMDVSLTTVKIRNWDNSISTIPPYTLISDSFRNYEGMREAGGRRVCRSVLIDINSIRFCTPAEIGALTERGFLDGLDIDNVERIINVQLLRRYLERYLARDMRVVHSMTCMVRQLDPTSTGLPLQLYFFTSTTEWVAFERIQADIFDHVYAIVNAFGLRIFQSPAGSDFNSNL